VGGEKLDQCVVDNAVKQWRSASVLVSLQTFVMKREYWTFSAVSDDFFCGRTNVMFALK